MTTLDVAAPVVRRRGSARLPGSFGFAVGGTVIGLLLFVAAAAPLLAPHNPNSIQLSQTLSGISRDHLLGTDAAGRDILSRLIYGTRLSLIGPMAVVLLSILIGVPAGLVAGYRGGWVDSVLSRIWDMVFGFPELIAHAARTRRLGAGTIVGSGTVSNKMDGKPARPIGEGGPGYSCLAELRMIETIDNGAPRTPFLKFGDRVRIEMLDAQGRSVFGAIEQTVARALP